MAPTGYDVRMYHHIEEMAKALTSIARSLEKIANPPVPTMEDPPDTTWARTTPLEST